ncbi:MAG TPA: CpaF family protein [Acidimicrobiia bacterium]|nr:CpaF family protein [Acidimicrobiia bacterium]
MKLSDRLRALDGELAITEDDLETTSSPDPFRVGSATPPEAPRSGRSPLPTDSFRPNADPLADFKARAKQALYGKLESRTIDARLAEPELRAAITAELERFLAETEIPLSAPERERIAAEISEDILGYGPIQRYLDDRDVTEIMVNATDPIFVERRGKISRTNYRFETEEHLRQVIDRIVASVGRRVDEASPMVDARLPDGSRVNAIIPPLAVDGPALTIRKFAADPYRVEDLISLRTMTPAMASLLDHCVRGKLNILISGGTGSGKTTLLNVMSGFVPAEERIVTIEDAVELQLLQEHVVRLESRPSNVEGRGQVTIRDLVRNSLRMRPDRIIVGEVRGAEALDMLQAMNTGHEGSMSTLHANTPRDALSRLETMVLMAGLDIPVAAIREYISSALSLIVQLSRLSDGTRRITQVTEVVGMEGDIITMQDVFRFHKRGLDEEGKVIGGAVATGIRPKFADKLAEAGLPLSGDLFAATAERAA